MTIVLFYEITDIYFYRISRSSHQTVESIIRDMLDGMGIVMEQREINNLATSILEHVIKRVSVTILIDKIIENLPEDPLQDHRNVIETTAEQLFALQDFAVNS